MWNSIVLIDDDQIFNFLNKRIVDKLQVFEKVEVFNDAKQAFEAIKTWDFLPDYILLDIRMPLMDGFEFLNRFDALPEALTKHTKIIIVTSSLLHEDHEKCSSYRNVVGFLPKPLSAERFRAFLD